MDSSSDFTISSDWDIIDDEVSQLVPDGTKSEEATSEDLKESDNMPNGSCVDDIPEPEITVLQEDSNVPDLKESEINNQQETSSCSEFDVLDETIEDSQNNLSVAHMEYSISSSFGDSSHPSLMPEVEAPEDTEIVAQPRVERPADRTPYHEQGLNIHPYLLAVVVALTVISVLIASLPFGSLQKMKDHIIELQTENYELKNLVHSKLENDKLLMGLEEQIKSLKDENFKLSESMKVLVAQLEEQTRILKKDKETKEQDPYRSEIERLKEQINILQIDNEELQNQLVRTRYGIYSPHPKESKTVEDKEEQKDTADNKENRDNSSEILVEEINELRKKLYSEVEKLKNWKDSVQDLVKKFGNGKMGSSVENENRKAESSDENEKQNFKNKESYGDSAFSSRKGEWKSKPGKKDTKYSDWSWKGVKKNLRNTFENFQDLDVSNMFSNYVDKKKIESVFESVGHYFKKAQEKTKKVLNFNNDVNHEMWQFFGQLKNQWDDISKKYYKTAKQASPNSGDRKPQFSKHKPDIPDFEQEEKFDRYQKQKKPSMKKALNMEPDVESFKAPPTPETPNAEKIEMGKPEDKEMNEDNSWVFRRAAHRSQLREEEQEAFTNWFLKRGRDFHYNEDESLKEWIKETYHNGHSGEE